MKTHQILQPDAATGFLNEKQLLEKLPISSRTLGNWKSRGLLPFIRLNGSRRILYDWKSVQEALLRQQRGGEQ